MQNTNEKADQSLDGVWDVSSGTTLANTAKAKLVAKDSVGSNQHLVQNQGLGVFQLLLVQGIAIPLRELQCSLREYETHLPQIPHESCICVLESENEKIQYRSVYSIL